MKLRMSAFSKLPLAVASASLMVTPVAAIAAGGEGDEAGVADDGTITLPGELPVSERFVPLDPFFVTIVDAGAMRGTLYIELVIDTQKLEHTSDVTEYLPQIRSDILAAATDFASWYGTPGAPIDAEELEIELSVAAPDGARILIREVRAGDTFRI